VLIPYDAIFTRLRIVLNNFFVHVFVSADLHNHIIHSVIQIDVTVLFWSTAIEMNYSEFSKLEF
jgi:hypothetical protein